MNAEDSELILQGDATPPSQEQKTEEPCDEPNAADVGVEDVEDVEHTALSEAEFKEHVQTAVDRGVERILEAFEAKLAYDAAKQLQIDRLHHELQQHRSNLVARATRPLINGIIHMHSDVGRLLDALRSKSPDQLTAERFFSVIEGIQEDIELLLGQNGVVAYREGLGEAFNPNRQRVLVKEVTHQEALKGTVARSVRPGFEQGSDLIEKEKVAVYIFKQKEEEKTPYVEGQ